MNSGIPSGPLIWTVVAVGLVNVVASYVLAHVVAPARAPVVPVALVVTLAIGAVAAVVVAVRGWRRHFRRRRMIS